MSKLPSFQFYPGDWMRNSNLRRCSCAARGAWMDIMCILHDSDEYGICRWPLKELAAAAGVPLKLAKELAEKFVLKGSDSDVLPYVFRPRHARKEGAPITLIEARSGPCWYSSRLVRDAYIRSQRGRETRFGDTPDDSPDSAPKLPPIATPKPRFGEGCGDKSGDGPSSASATAVIDSPIARESGSGGAEKNPQVTPPTLEQVKATAANQGVSPDCAEMFFLDCETSGWVDSKQRPIRNWRAAMTAYATRWRANDFQRKQQSSSHGKHSTSRPPSPANNHSANAGAAGDY